jgi:hypothetical protein
MKFISSFLPAVRTMVFGLFVFAFLVGGFLAVIAPVVAQESEHTTYLTNTAELTTGSNHSCASTDSGAVFCWGSNNYGQNGDNKTWTTNLTPVRVLAGEAGGPDADGAYLTNVAQVSAGLYYTCALTNSGAVYCWGSNQFGQLGDNTTANRSTPVRVLAGAADDADGDGGFLSGVSNISAGAYHVCANTHSDAVYCWGHNFGGQLGDNTTTNRSTPVRVLAGAAVDSNTDGTYLIGVAELGTGGSHTCARTNSGAVYCWGSNSHYGTLGDGTRWTTRLTPVQVLAGEAGGSDTDGTYLSNTVDITVGSNHTCARTNSNAMYCWGDNYNGQLGDNATTNRLSPVRVLAGESIESGTDGAYLTNVTAFSSGRDNTCASTASGAAYCWGSGSWGQLGNGDSLPYDSSYSSTAVRVLAGEATEPDAEGGYLTRVAKLSTGSSHSCALTAGGTAYCWGFNYGALGDNTTAHRSTPVRVLAGEAVGFDPEHKPPSVHTLEVSDITSTSATLNGVINPNGLETTVIITWGLSSTSQSGATTLETKYNGTDEIPVSFVAEDLEPNTTYVYRVVASNKIDATFGEFLEFTTKSANAVTCDVSTIASDWIASVMYERRATQLVPLSTAVSGGRAYIPPENRGSLGTFWTNFSLDIPKYLDGDNIRVDVRMKAPYSDGSIWAQDPAVVLVGSEGNGQVQWMGEASAIYWTGLYAGETFAQGNVAGLVQNFNDWQIVSLELKDGIATALFNYSQVFSMPYTGSVGDIEKLIISFKGSGSVDWIKIYQNEYLRFVEEFNTDGMTTAYFVCDDSNPDDSSPTPTPSTKFSHDDRVQVVNGPVNVRQSAGGIELGTQDTGAVGTVTAGPEWSSPNWFWYVQFDSGVSGWVAEAFLQKYTDNATDFEAFDPQPITYPIIEIDDETKNLIFITHGWNSDEDAWAKAMKEEIEEVLRDRGISDHWEVVTHDWQDQAKMFGNTSLLESFNPAVVAYDLSPWHAYMQAEAQGKAVGSGLAKKNLSSIHFIAHSAGSNLIHYATQSLRKEVAKSGKVQPFVHSTFLDPFKPAGWLEQYGDQTDYAEQYIDSLLPSTDTRLWKAVTFDVTEYKTHWWSHTLGHGLPIEYYRKSIVDKFIPGFPYSRAYGNITLPDGQNGRYCTVTGTLPNPSYNCTTNLEAIVGVTVDTITGLPTAYKEVIMDPNGELFLDTYELYVRTATNIGDWYWTKIAEPGGELLTKSVTGTVDFLSSAQNTKGRGGMRMRTQSPVWASLVIETTEPSNYFSFSLESEEGAGKPGQLTVFLNGTMVYVADTGFFEHETLESIVRTLPGFVDAGRHVLTFRLDSYSEESQQIFVSDISLLNVSLVEASDVFAPTTNITLTGTLLTTDTYLNTTTLTLTAEDNEGGVGLKSTEYSFDGETWIEYVTPVEVTEEGAHTIYYRSIDWFGNMEETQSVTFTIVKDTLAPNTTLEAKSTGETPWFNSGIEVTLSAIDDISGVDTTEYSLDLGGTWIPYTAPFVLYGEPKYTIWYRSTDTAGNTEEVNVEILDTSLIINPGLSTAQQATTRRGSSGGTRVLPTPLPQVLGVATTALSVEEEEKIALQKQIIELLRQLIELLKLRQGM